ncbi:MAG: hypothetical protein NC416_12725 [Eubacterium sp.]|nr:hypothetical protein [Eubacterium sp.]
MGDRLLIDCSQARQAALVGRTAAVDDGKPIFYNKRRRLLENTEYNGLYMAEAV